MSQLDSKPEENQRPDRRQRKKARTRRDLVEAAVRLFDERGFEGTTIEDITNAADVSPRTTCRTNAVLRFAVHRWTFSRSSSATVDSCPWHQGARGLTMAQPSRGAG